MIGGEGETGKKLEHEITENVLTFMKPLRKHNMYQTFRRGQGRVHPVAVIIHVSPLISRSIFMFKCDHDTPTSWLGHLMQVTRSAPYRSKRL